jgi:hypothetical protein
MVMGIQTSIRPISITEFRPPMELLNPNDKSNASNSTELIENSKVAAEKNQQMQNDV